MGWRPVWPPSGPNPTDEPLFKVNQGTIAALRDHIDRGHAEDRTDGIERRVSADRYWASIQPIIKQFGITRISDITGLDRIGIPVVQAFRPGAKSNVVNQGKGFSMSQAALSAVMEALETWAAERLAHDRMRSATAREILPTAQLDAFEPGANSASLEDWRDVPRNWVPGWDIANSTIGWCPAALVATDYTLTSPYRSEPFHRTTTGLGAGASARDAVRHGLAEIVERDATARAMQTHGFFDRFRLTVTTIDRASLARLVKTVNNAGLLIGFWDCPAPVGWSVVWARILEGSDSPDQLPFPADGFAASPCLQSAAEKALLEAVQTRASVIAGGREDITRRAYPRFPKRDLIDAERNRLSVDDGTPFAPETSDPMRLTLDTLADGTRRPVIAVPLYAQTDPDIHVVRVVVPGLNAGSK